MRTTDTTDTRHSHSCADCYAEIPCTAEWDRGCVEPICDECSALDQRSYLDRCGVARG